MPLLILGLVVFGRPAVGAQSEGGDARRGEQVFQASCAMCHGSDATGMMGMHPSLRGAVDRLSPEGAEVAVRKGRDTMPPMPAFEGRLSDQAIVDVLAYVASLPPGPRNFGPEGDGMGGMGGMGDMMGGREGDGLAAWLGAALVVAVLALGAMVTLVVRQRRLLAVDGADARSVLDRRYAAGELSREEYLERRQDLED